MESWVNVLRSVGTRAQALVLPPVCVLCAQSGQDPLRDLCAACEQDLPRNFCACVQCAEPLVSVVGSARCGACLRRPPRFQSTHCAFRYAYPVDHMIRALKYHGRQPHARVLGHLLAESLRARANAVLPDAIVPVPLAPVRYRERGFNQAVELGKYAAHALNVPLRADLVVRQRETLEQAALDRAERRKNLRRAFAVTGAVQGRRLAILDDVVTTGSTANEVARVLRRAGARCVEVWAVARAQR